MTDNAKPTEAQGAVNNAWLQWKAGELTAEEALNQIFDEVVCPPLPRSSAPQEPDDDAEWLRNILPRSIVTGTKHEVLHRIEAIANRLQAKAPETPYCGIVVVDEADFTTGEAIQNGC